MPIYEYTCRACGVQRDVMQKVSESPLTHCSACGAEAFEKKVSAAGFQLKGGGWYVTDFRDGSRKAAGGTDAAADAPATSAPASTPVGGDSAPSTPAPVASPASVD